MNHELLIAKFHAYGFSTDAFRVLLSNLQRSEINTTFSSWTQLLQVVPHGSVCGPKSFIIYINNILLNNVNILKELTYVTLQTA